MHRRTPDIVLLVAILMMFICAVLLIIVSLPPQGPHIRHLDALAGGVRVA